MDQFQERRNLGSYEITSELTPCPLSRRWCAVHVHDQSTHVLYELTHCRERAEQRRLVAAVQRLAELKHSHILPVERLTLSGGEPWLVTPYTGNQEGLVTLSALLSAKGGVMTGAEAARALAQLLSALGYAHEKGYSHGPISIDEVLVDRHGSVSIELFGLARGLAGLERGDAELRMDEVRSIVELGYLLVTGRVAEEPRIAACRLSPKLDRRWDEWFDRGLDALGGFRSVEEALEAFPTRTKSPDNAGGVSAVKVVIGRMRSALRQN